MCETCGKPKCACGKDTCSSGAAVVIKNATEYVNFRKVLVPASVRSDETNPPKNGEYCNTLLVFEATGNAYLYSSDGVATQISDRADIRRLERLIEAEATTREDEDKKLAQAIIDEADIRSSADTEIWTEIETIEASSDVVDIVGTYAELQQYDTSKLHDKDLIKVLQDETHDDAITYYRWSTTTDTFTYVGAEGPYYTCSETDTLLADKQDKLIAGSNIQIASDGKTISATDTTYSDFTGATTQQAGTHGLVPAPTVSDPEKFLKGDGTWGTPIGKIYTAGAGINIDSSDEISVDTTVVQEKLTAGSNISITGTTISATDTTYSNFAGATAQQAGSAGLVPAPTTSDPEKFLKGDGTWGTPIGKVYTAGTHISISNADVISVTDMPVLYTTYGNNEDGAVTQKYFTEVVGDVETILQTLNSGAGVQ